MSDKGVIEIIARACVVRGGRLLTCHKLPASNEFLPGGHVEFCEPAAAAMTRELLEETGMAAEARRFLGAVEHCFVQDGEKHSEVNLVFEADIPGLEADAAPRSREPDLEFSWRPLAELERSALEPFVLKTCLPDWLRPGYAGERWRSTLAR